MLGALLLEAFMCFAQILFTVIVLTHDIFNVRSSAIDVDVSAASFLDQLSGGPHADAPRVTFVGCVLNSFDPALRRASAMFLLTGELPEVALTPRDGGFVIGFQELSTDSVSSIMITPVIFASFSRADG